MIIPIENDLYEIAWRIKQIDENYSIMYDTNLCKFLLYAKNEFQINLPYSVLDERTLIYVKHTRIENLDTLIREVDKYNEESEKSKVLKSHDELENKFSLALK